MNMSMQQIESCSESRMRSRTSRGVPEWSGGKELYIGSQVSAIGTSFGVIGIVPGPPEGSRGPTGWGHLSRGATWAVGGAPSPPGAGSPPTSAHGALRDGWPHPVDPRDPSGGPGTIPVTPNPSRWPKPHFLYIILHLRTILELLVTFGISSGTPNNFRVAAYNISTT